MLKGCTSPDKDVVHVVKGWWVCACSPKKNLNNYEEIAFTSK